MDASRSQFFRELLNERKAAVLREIEPRPPEVAEREAGADDADIASEEIERGAVDRLQDRERRLLNKIEEALVRLDAGTYGVCEACGEPIDERRLMARPVATHCIDCKTEAEQLEGRRRAF